MKDVHCKNCNKLLFRAHVFVGEVKCKCGYTAEYRIMTESFVRMVQDGDAVVNRAMAGVGLAPA